MLQSHGYSSKSSSSIGYTTFHALFTYCGLLTRAYYFSAKFRTMISSSESFTSGTIGCGKSIGAGCTSARLRKKFVSWTACAISRRRSFEASDFSFLAFFIRFVALIFFPFASFPFVGLSFSR